MSSDRVLIVIPARMKAARFPGKPLAMIDNTTLLGKTYLRASQARDMCSLQTDVLVSTPDNEIMDWCGDEGIPCVQSPAALPTGTHRCAYTLSEMEKDKYQIVVNWQVDEPWMNPKDVVCLMHFRPSSGIATLVALIGDRELYDSNVVKVAIEWIKVPRLGVCENFSRKAIYRGLGHVGIYLFNPDTLLKLGMLEPTEASIRYGLEQLAWLENGYKIEALRIDSMPRAINVPGDLT